MNLTTTWASVSLTRCTDLPFHFTWTPTHAPNALAHKASCSLSVSSVPCSVCFLPAKLNGRKQRSVMTTWLRPRIGFWGGNSG